MRWVLVAACMVAAFLGSFWAHGGLPSLGDFGDWVYEGVLLRDVLLVQPQHLYLIKHYPVPNSFNTLLMGVLMLGMPWQWAAKLYLCLQLAFQFCAAVVFFYACRSVRPAVRPEIWLIVPGAILLGVNFWYGFMNFQTGVAWAMLVCALLLWRAGPVAPYAVLLVCTFFTHMIPCAFACLALIAAAVYDRRPALLRALVPTAVLTIWYLIGRFFYAHNADARARIDTKIVYLSKDFFAYKINSFLKSFGFVNPSTNADHSLSLYLLGDKLYFALFLINAILAAIFLWLIVQRCYRSIRIGALDAFLWTAVLVFGVIYLVAPGSALGVSDPGARALQVALWTAMFLAAGSRWPVRIAAACAVILFAANFYLFNRLAMMPTYQKATSGEMGVSIALNVDPPSKLPRAVTHFGHIPFQDKTQYYQALEEDDMELDIFPTGMFLKR